MALSQKEMDYLNEGGYWDMTGPGELGPKEDEGHGGDPQPVPFVTLDGDFTRGQIELILRELRSL